MHPFHSVFSGQPNKTIYKNFVTSYIVKKVLINNRNIFSRGGVVLVTARKMDLLLDVMDG